MTHMCVRLTSFIMSISSLEIITELVPALAAAFPIREMADLRTADETQRLVFFFFFFIFF